MTKAVDPICNLDCKYCFYLEKENLYSKKANWGMPEVLLFAIIQGCLQNHD